MTDNRIKDTKDVKPQKFALIEPRQYYGGFVWYDKETGDFMLACKEKDKIDLNNVR